MGGRKCSTVACPTNEEEGHIDETKYPSFKKEPKTVEKSGNQPFSLRSLSTGHLATFQKVSFLCVSVSFDLSLVLLKCLSIVRISL